MWLQRQAAFEETSSDSELTMLSTILALHWLLQTNSFPISIQHLHGNISTSQTSKQRKYEKYYIKIYYTTWQRSYNSNCITLRLCSISLILPDYDSPTAQGEPRRRVPVETQWGWPQGWTHLAPSHGDCVPFSPLPLANYNKTLATAGRSASVIWHHQCLSLSSQLQETELSWPVLDEGALSQRKLTIYFGQPWVKTSRLSDNCDNFPIWTPDLSRLYG